MSLDSNSRQFRNIYRKKLPTEPRPLLESFEMVRPHRPQLSSYARPIGEVIDPPPPPSKWQLKWDAEREQARRSFLNYLQRHATLPITQDELESLVAQHGIFAGEIVARRRVVEDWSVVDRSKVDPEDWLRHWIASFGGNPQNEYALEWGRISFQSFQFLLDEMFRQIAGNRRGRQLIQSWHLEVETSGCSFCGNKFDLSQLLPYYYVMSHYHRDCCFRCVILENPRRPVLDERIRAFVDACGDLPPTCTAPIDWRVSARLDHDSWAEMTRRYAEMGGMAYVTAVFPSWFEAMALSGALPDGVIATKRGIRCLAKDGHVCGSLAERRIDDWLTDHNVPHEREPHYPRHLELNPGSLRADWAVGDVLIEYFGMTGDEVYDQKTAQKKQLAEAVGVKLIAIYPIDLHRLDNVLNQLLDK